MFLLTELLGIYAAKKDETILPLDIIVSEEQTSKEAVYYHGKRYPSLKGQ